MTIPEAIKWYEAKLEVNKRVGLLGPQNEAAKLALAALREQEERKANPALTVDELREMGGQPYWHVGLLDKSREPHWAILPDNVAKSPQDYSYGESWLAYRRKLGEAEPP